jgi:hypothetical protein
MVETARGFLTKAALTREAIVTTPTWPAASAQAAAALLPLLSEDVRERPVRQAVTTALGTVAPDTLSRPVSGSVALLATYNGLELIYALSLGFQGKRYSGTVYPASVSTGAWRHRFEIDDDLRSVPWEEADGFVEGELDEGTQRIRRATLCVDKQLAVWESLSTVVGSLELEATSARVALSLGVVAHSITRASLVNPNLDALATPAAFYPLRFSELVCRVGPYSASTALGSSNVLAVSGVRLALDNRLGAPVSRLTHPYIDEPARTAPAAVQGTFSLPRYQADTLLALADAGTELMADLIWTGPLIPGTSQPYQLAVYLPGLTFLDGEAPIVGPQWAQLSFPWTAYPKTPGAGFPVGLRTGAMMIECVTGLSTNPLLEE